MSIIIEKTYQFLDELEQSTLIMELKQCKKQLLLNQFALDLIKQYNSTNDDSTKLTIKQSLYQNPNYQRYMELYNELAMIIFRINQKFSEYTNTKNCQSSK